MTQVKPQHANLDDVVTYGDYIIEHPVNAWDGAADLISLTVGSYQNRLGIRQYGRNLDQPRFTHERIIYNGIVGEWGGSIPVPPDPPGPIADLVATAISSSQVQLTFTPSANATSHQFRYTLAGTGNWTTPATLIGGMVSGLDAETNYDFQVRGVNVSGFGDWSNTDSAQTEAAAGAPDPIIDLVATPVSVSSVELTFTPAVGATSHQFRRALAGSGSWTTPATLVSNTVADLEEGTNYDFQVRGVNAIGPGDWSNTATAQTDVQTPAWVLQPGGNAADLDYDFVGNQYWPHNSLIVQRNTPGYIDDLAGNWTEVPANQLRRSQKGLLIEEQRINSLRNNSMQGATGGAPGTLPTNWSENVTGPDLSLFVVGTGVEQGVDYIDVRIFGTSNSSSPRGLYFETSTFIPAIQGESWAASVFLELQAGSLTGLTSLALHIDEYDSGGALLNSHVSPPVTPTPRLRATHTVELIQAGAAHARPLLAFTVNSGNTVELTLRVGWPQFEIGPYATSPIRTAGTPVERTADIISVLFANAGDPSTLYTQSVIDENSGLRWMATLSDGTDQNYIGHDFSVGEGAYISSAGVSGVLVGLNDLGAPPAADTVVKIATKAEANSYRTSLNGNAVLSEFSGTPMPTVDVLLLGNNAGLGMLNGYLQRVALFRTGLADALLQEITEIILPSVTTEFTDSAVSPADQSVYNLSVGAGAEAANRSLVAVIVSRATGPRVLNDVVIGGVPAEQMASRIVHTDGSNRTIIEYWGAPVPNNDQTTNVSVDITFDASMLRCGVAMYRVENLPSLIPYAAAGVSPNGAGILTAPLEVPERGSALAAIYSIGTSGSWGSDLTQDVSRVIEGTQRLIAASADFATAQEITAQITAGTETANQLLTISLGGELPSDIGDLVATTASANSVNLAFTPATGATSYQERHALAGSGIWTTPATLSSNTVSGLDPETNYDFQVRAVNNIGPADWSNTDSALTTGSLPAAPSSLIMTAATDTGLSDTDGITSDTTPTFNVVFDPAMVAGDTVSIYRSMGPTLLASHPLSEGEATAGNIDITPPAFDDGTYQLYATGTNIWGEGPRSTPLNITIDTQPPDAIGFDPPDNIPTAFITDVLKVFFNKAVSFGPSFTISLFLTDDTPVQTWTQANIGTTVTLNDDLELRITLAAEMLQGTGYYATITSDAVRSISGIAFPGFLDETSWNWTTETGEGVLWNEADKDPLVFLTSGGREANNSGISDLTQQVRATHGLGIGGKVYFEMDNLEDGGGTSNSYFGLANAAHNLTTAPGENANSIAIRRSDKAIRYNAATVGTVGTGTAFATMGFAVHRTGAATALVWMRYENGNWNNSSANNPDTGVGGIPITISGDLFPLACVGRSSAITLLRSRELEFLYLRPATFPPLGNLQSPDPVPLAYGGTGVATWNSADKDPGVALSGGNLVATNSSTESATRKVRATTGITEHVYVEIQITANGTGAINNRVGLANATFNVTDTSQLGAGVNSIGIDQATGNILINGATIGSIGAGYVQGDVIRFDVDRAGNLLYVRRNAVPWNNDPTANPINKIGGIDISGVVGALFPTVMVGRVGASAQMYTTDLTFQYPRIDPPVIAYVDATLGSDVNDGSEAFPWKTISKINSMNLYIGSVINFKRGEVWRGGPGAGNPGLICRPGVTYQAYGTGMRPQFNFQIEHIGVAGDWVDQGSNRWAKSGINFPANVPALQRICVTFDGIAANVRKTSVGAVTQLRDYHWTTAGTLTVFSIGNPTLFYSSIAMNNSTVAWGALMSAAPNAVFDDIDVIGAQSRGTGQLNSPNSMISNCDTFYHGTSGFYPAGSPGARLHRVSASFNCNSSTDAGLHGIHTQGNPANILVTESRFEANMMDAFQSQAYGNVVFEDCTFRTAYININAQETNCVDLKNCNDLWLIRCILETGDDHAITSQVRSDGFNLVDTIINSHTDNRCIHMQEGPGHYTSKRTAFYMKSSSRDVDIYGSGGKWVTHESDIFVHGGSTNTSASCLTNYSGKLRAIQTMFLSFSPTGDGCRTGAFLLTSSTTQHATTLSHDGIDDGTGHALATMAVTFLNWGPDISFRLSGMTGPSAVWNGDYETLEWDPPQWGPPWLVRWKVPITYPQNPDRTGLILSWAPRVGPLENCIAMAAGSNGSDDGAYIAGLHKQAEKTNAAYIIKAGTPAGITSWNEQTYSLADSTQDGVGLHLASGGLWGGDNWKGVDLAGSPNTEFDFYTVNSLTVTIVPGDIWIRNRHIVTATRAAGHPYQVGDRVCIQGSVVAGAVPTRLNGWKKIESVTSTTFTYEAPFGTAAQTATGTITVTDFSPSATAAHASGAPVVWAPSLMSENKDFKGNEFAPDSQRSWGAIQAPWTAEDVISEFTGSAVSAADLSSYSFANIAAGAEADNRYLVVAIASRATAARTLNSVTIAGIPATEIATSIFNDSSTNHTATSFYGAAVPTGTTATVDVTFSGTMLRCGVGLYRLVDLLSLTPVDTGIAGASAGNFFMETVVDVSAGACVLSVGFTATGTISWGPNLTEDFRQLLEGVQWITSASADFASAQSVTARIGLSSDSPSARLLAIALR